MSAKRGVTLRSQWLGKQLRELREAAGLTLKEAGDFLQRDASTISRLEAGIYPARPGDVEALLGLYGISHERQRDGLVRLSREAWQNGWWDAYAGDVGHGIVDNAWLESRAKQIRSFDALVIPGLLQTRDYMDAVMRAADWRSSEEQIARWIEFRLIRQQVLAASVPGLVVVLDEAVLRRTVGGREVMRAQLGRLTETAKQSHVEIRVLPQASGAHASPDGAFKIYELPEPYPAIAYVSSPAGVIYVEAEEAERLMLKFDAICRDSLGSEESLDLIVAVAEELG
ncbi:helix-turn-helix domain-containing protein [Sphaerisporangium rhizosphaerae]|uniref:Helix-turn-helix domain-containing protein n=1 Tax=Sphaerisporangium rhizosphaerae TaxID=2269375 RepID=A0ABW2PEI7_9ACTN